MELKNISNLAITLLVTVIVLVLMAVVLQGFQSNQQDTLTNHANVTLTWAGNNTGITLGESRINVGSLVLWNNNTLINQGLNYTVTASSIIITNISGIGGQSGMYSTGAFNASYMYNIGSVAYNSSTFGLSTMTTLSSYMPLLALVSIAAVVVGIVLVMFRRKNQ
jgi:hypothetical protein